MENIKNIKLSQLFIFCMAALPDLAAVSLLTDQIKKPFPFLKNGQFCRGFVP
jgi:hypothetical protein